MTKYFSDSEKNIVAKFPINGVVTYEGKKYKIIKACKPFPPSGECKTDFYLLLQNVDNKAIKELKISIKQKNADFLENKISLKRAKQIFGSNASKIIQESLLQIKSEFEKENLVFFDKQGRTEAKTLKIGWKFELLNRKSGHKSAKMKLDRKQLIDIYAGTNLDTDKKNSYVDGDIVENSGVASHILIIETNSKLTSKELLEKLIPIKEFIKNKEVYFACKAINYRVTKDKWDENRPLSVFVEWQENRNEITASLIFDKPLSTKANIIGTKIQEILRNNDIDAENFSELEPLLSDEIRYFKK